MDAEDYRDHLPCPGSLKERQAARIKALEDVFRKLQMTGLAVEALLADEPTSVYIHPEIWARLKEHRGHLRRSLELLNEGK